MSNRKSARKVRKTYQSIESNRHRFPVQAMCQVPGVAPRGYYEWLKHIDGEAYEIGYSALSAFVGSIIAARRAGK